MPEVATAPYYELLTVSRVKHVRQILEGYEKFPRRRDRIEEALDSLEFVLAEGSLEDLLAVVPATDLESLREKILEVVSPENLVRLLVELVRRQDRQIMRFLDAFPEWKDDGTESTKFNASREPDACD